MIHWEKYFDKAYVIDYLYDGRRSSYMSEFGRVGLLDIPYFMEPVIQTDSPIYDKMIHSLNDSNLIYDKDGNTYERCRHIHAKVTYNHYFTIERAYALGYDHILMMENDIRFLKDLDSINNILETTNFNTTDVDIIMYDWIVTSIEVRTFLLASCYALNRNGMKYIIDNIERCDGKIFVIDQYMCENEYSTQIYTDDGNTQLYSYDFDNYSDIKPKLQYSVPRLAIQPDINKYNDAPLLKTDLNNIDVSLYNL